MSTNRNLIGFLLFASFHSFQVWAQAPAIVSLVVQQSASQVYDKQEFKIETSGAISNPYDYSAQAFRGRIVRPSGIVDTVDAFFFRDYSLNQTNGSLTNGDAGTFRLRYTPTEAGQYSTSFFVATSSGNSSPISGPSFSVAAGNRKGFVRSSKNGYLRYDDSTQYFAIGHNLAWQQNNKYTNYKTWLTQLAADSGNFVRYWNCSWGLGLEWTGSGYSGLKNYQPENSYYLDKILEMCEERGVQLMFCLFHHGMVSTNVNPNWSPNPYNTSNGGMCSNPQAFFTNASARAAQQNLFRYCQARWGYSTSLFAWELFNEVDWTDDFANTKANVRNWHQAQARFIKQNDPYRHFVTTSYAHDYEDSLTWKLPEMDLTQTHYYISSPNPEMGYTGGLRNYRSRFGKPTLNGEFGIDPAAINLTSVDPNGVYVHNAVWATALSGGFGSAASWWWDSYIHPQNLTRHYRPVSAFLANVDLAERGFVPATASVTGAGSDLQILPQGGWGAPGAENFSIAADGSLSPDASQLCTYLYGASWNTNFRRPPSFSFSNSQPITFTVRTGSSTGTAPKILLILDGNPVLNPTAAINTNYSITIPAGTHVVKVDNNGTDWITISSYTFTGMGSAINSYTMRSTDGTWLAWIHNKAYNHVRLASGTPSAITGAQVRIPATNGSYRLRWFDCTLGQFSAPETVTAQNGNLDLPIASLVWDRAFMLEPITAGESEKTKPTESQLRVLPNPWKEGPVRIMLPIPAHSARIEVLDLQGRVVQRRQVPVRNQQAELDLPSEALPAGSLYILRCQLPEGQVYTTRFTHD